MSRPLTLAGRGLTWALLLGTLVLPYPGGYPLAYFLILVSLLLCLWLLPARIVPRLEPAGLMFLGAFVLIAIAFLATGSLALVTNFAMFVVFVPLAAALARNASPGGAVLVARLALLGAAVALGIAAWEVFGLRHGRAAGFNSDPIWSAQAAVVLGFLALVGLPQAAGIWRLLYWLGPVFGMATALLAGSRGPLLAVPVLFVVAMFLVVRRWWLALPVIVATGFAAVAVVGVVYPGSLTRLASLTTIAGELASGGAVSEVSSGQRLAFYQSAFSAFLEKPLFGYGWDNKVAAIRPYLADGGAMLDEGHHHLHSDILDFGVSAGALGLLAYALIIAAPIAGALALPRDSQYRSRLAGTALLAVGYLVCGLTYLMLGYEFHTTLYVCLAAILLGYCRDAPTPAAAGPACRLWPPRRWPRVRPP
ncbi:MAG: O-antigen ligase family protein [Devosia sp.]|nr:O-antigen ligase family protein [Devosia sp.]